MLYLWTSRVMKGPLEVMCSTVCFTRVHSEEAHVSICHPKLDKRSWKLNVYFYKIAMQFLSMEHINKR